MPDALTTTQGSRWTQGLLRFWPLPAVALSAIFTLLHAGPLRGSNVALVITVACQFYLPGLLLLRALNIDRSPHPISRFVWVLVAAFALDVSFGAALRFLALPITTYLLALHLLMLVLTLIRLPLPPVEPIAWRFRWRSLPLYVMVGVCCAVVVGVSLERDLYRFSGYEDQSVFVELAEWMAHGADPVGILSRRVGVNTPDTRWDTDGWTYNQSAWVAASGVSAADLIWFRVTPLFAWATPLAIFALVFELTRRETTAAWATAALTILGLLTIDSLVAYPTTITFGQFSLFEVNTLRTIATALVTPLALMPLLAYLQTKARRFLIVGLLGGAALAVLHPRQIVILLYSIGAAGLLQTLAKPSWRQLRQAALLAFVLGLLVLIPLTQQLRRSATFDTAFAAQDTQSQNAFLDQAREAGAAQNALSAGDDSGKIRVAVWDEAPRARYLVISNLPILHSTTILDPSFVFYHPLLLAATILGLLIGIVGWRRGLTAQYILGATVFSLILLFVPVIAQVYAKLVTSALAAGSILGVPFALIFGLCIEGVIERLRWRAANALVALLLVGVMALLLFEPIPIPASARDQIRTSNALQETRDMLAADQSLIDSLQAHLAPNRVSVVISPNRAANYISESVSRTYITGGRESGNRSYDLTQAFMGEGEGRTVWLTQAEIDGAAKWRATDVVVEADNWRLAQMALETPQFTLLDSPPGYVVFAFDPQPISEMLDRLDAAMNQLAAQTGGRWLGNGLDLNKPGAPDAWTPIVKRADALPDGERADLARAFARTMAGDDAGALPLWQTLDQAHPDAPVFAQVSAATLAALGRPADGKTLLLTRLDSANPSAAAMAARALLADSFFYLLTPDELDRVIAVTEKDAAAWDFLAEYDRPQDIRQRVALLMSVGRFDLAEQWSQRLPTAEVRPEDLVTQASIELSRGNVEAALARLQPATDADWTTPNRHLHADWWQNNAAAQTYHLLKGEIARRSGQYTQAEAEFNAAIQLGSTLAGRAFLAQTLRESGDTAGADQATAALQQAWSAQSSAPLPEFASLLTLADTHQLYAMTPSIELDDAAHTLAVTATYGNAHSAPLAVRTWRLAVLSGDGTQTYAQADVPAVFVPGALTRASAALTLPDDLPPLTPATVYVQPRYDNRVNFGALTVPVVLNRPADAQPPADAAAIDARFGDQIALVSAAGKADADSLSLSLYWRADATPTEADQVFVHILDAGGNIVVQSDSAPANGRYPTDQWRANTLIEDTHMLAFETPLPSGSYRVVTGLYRLSDLQKLAISGTTLPVLDGRLQVFDFNIP